MSTGGPVKDITPYVLYTSTTGVVHGWDTFTPGDVGCRLTELLVVSEVVTGGSSMVNVETLDPTLTSQVYIGIGSG